MPVRDLPGHPNVRQLKHQAKDLLRAARAGEPAALAAFAEFHPQPIKPSSATLADAHLVLARSYQAASWPQLMAVCGVIEAITANDFETVRRLTRAHPTLVHDRRGGDAGWRPGVVHAANLALRRVVTTLQGHGVRDVSAALGRPDLRQWIEALRLLGQVGAQPPKDAVGGAVEILQGADFAFMVEVGAEVRGHEGLAALALETYTRNPVGKHRILEVMAEQGVPLPDTAPMAVHRGRIDRLGWHLQRDPGLLARTFSHQDIWPPSLDCHADESLALHGAPLAGATLLHMAVDYEECAIAEWLLDGGADVNARALVDASGFGGHTPLLLRRLMQRRARRRSACPTASGSRRRSQRACIDQKAASVRPGQDCSRIPRRDAARLGTPVPRPVIRVAGGHADDRRTRRPRMRS